MGLDMYLSVRRYVSQYNWEGDKKVADPRYQAVLDTAELSSYSGSEYGGATVEAIAVYWRKANSIHQWFVDNCAGGIDDCRPVGVTYSHLEELLNAIEEVLKDRSLAQDLLPTQAGFFFGATEYDEYYWENLEWTKKALKKLLKQAKDDDVTFIYEASW